MQNKQVLSKTDTKRNLFQSQSVLESSLKSPTPSNKFTTRHMQMQSQVITKTSEIELKSQVYNNGKGYLNQDKSTDVVSPFYSDDSENDIFRDNVRHYPKTANGQMKSRSKILNQMAYITQKMMPEFQRGMQLISSAEDKVLDFRVEQTEQSIKSSNQSLAQGEILINYQHDKHPIELRPDIWNVQSVRQMEFYYYKIRAKLQPVPLQFYMNQTENTNFKIFVSSVNPFPTKFSCDQIISVKGWKYKIDESKIFHADYIYISMVCDLDTTIKLKFVFGGNLLKRQQTSSVQNSAKKHDPQLIMLKNIQKDIKLERMNSELLKIQVAEIKKRRKLKLQARGMFKDLIKENIQKVIEYNEDQQKSFRELKRIQYDNRIEDVLVRKKQMNQEEQQRKEVKQSSKELGKIIRQRHNFFQQKKYLKNRVCSHWFNSIYMAILCSRINYIFQHKIETIKQSRLMAFQVKRIMKRIHNRLSAIKGVTLFDRAFFDTKLALQCFCKAVYHKQVKLHIQKIIQPLRHRAEMYHFKNQVLITHQKILKIRIVFIEFLLRYKNYKLTLLSIWNKYFREQFLKYYNSLDQTKKDNYQPLLVQIQNGDNYNFLQQLFVESFSKDKLRKFCKQMSIYSNYIKKLRTLKYNKGRKSDIQHEVNQQQPRLFHIPTYEDVLDYLPQLINNRLDQRTSIMSQSQIVGVQEVMEKKKKQQGKQKK